MYSTIVDQMNPLFQTTHVLVTLSIDVDCTKDLCLHHISEPTNTPPRMPAFPVAQVPSDTKHQLTYDE